MTANAQAATTAKTTLSTIHGRPPRQDYEVVKTRMKPEHADQIRAVKARMEAFYGARMSMTVALLLLAESWDKNGRAAVRDLKV